MRLCCELTADNGRPKNLAYTNSTAYFPEQKCHNSKYTCLPPRFPISPGVKRGRGVMLTTHPLLVPKLTKSRSYTSSHPSSSMACRGTTLTFTPFPKLWIHRYAHTNTKWSPKQTAVRLTHIHTYIQIAIKKIGALIIKSVSCGWLSSGLLRHTVR
jgi:hypothetical protein